jgi:hypothetical protein
VCHTGKVLRQINGPIISVSAWRGSLNDGDADNVWKITCRGRGACRVGGSPG